MTFTTPEFRQPRDTGHRRGRRWLITVAVVAVIAVLAAIIAAVVTVVADHGTSNLGRPATSGPQPDSDAVTWAQVGPVQLPFSTTAGPQVQDGVTASGYAHTPTGALIAALQIPLRVYSLAGTDAIIANQVLGDDADKDQVRADAAQLQAGLNTGQLLPRPFAWRTHTPYTDQDASFDIATARQDGQYNIIRFAVVWVGGDWRYQPGLYGDASNNPVSSSTLTAADGWNHFTDRSLR